LEKVAAIFSNVWKCVLAARLKNVQMSFLENRFLLLVKWVAARYFRASLNAGNDGTAKDRRERKRKTESRQ